MESNLNTKSNFVQIVQSSTVKKEGLYDQSKSHYFVRAMYAGAMLVLATAAGVYAADFINIANPQIGKFLYAFLFAFGLCFILFLHHELVTSNMMYLTAGAYHKMISVNKVVQILIFCTLGNLAGALIMGWLVAQTTPFQTLTIDNFIVATAEAKLAKDLWTVFLEGILANIYVNIAILGFLFAKNEVAKIILVFGAIFMFVFLGYEHVVANFGTFGILIASTYHSAPLAISNVLVYFGVAWVGNYIGGGILMGLVYAWYNNDGLALLD